SPALPCRQTCDLRLGVGEPLAHQSRGCRGSAGDITEPDQLSGKRGIADLPRASFRALRRQHMLVHECIRRAPRLEEIERTVGDWFLNRYELGRCCFRHVHSGWCKRHIEETRETIPRSLATLEHTDEPKLIKRFAGICHETFNVLR